jgi:hypothetical protein
VKLLHRLLDLRFGVLEAEEDVAFKLGRVGVYPAFPVEKRQDEGVHDPLGVTELGDLLALDDIANRVERGGFNAAVVKAAG